MYGLLPKGNSVLFVLKGETRTGGVVEGLTAGGLARRLSGRDVDEASRRLIPSKSLSGFSVLCGETNISRKHFL